MRKKKKARQIKESHSEGEKLENIRLITKGQSRAFPGGPVVKNLPYNAWDAGSIPGLGRPHMPEQLNLSTPTRESMCHNERAHTTQLRSHVLRL